ncbi:primosomal protein N' [Thioalkalivibrio halophilus]|uniref:Replication restart protein PriA n=1 Tax=Thioalkalivibrio halophilus TaxID=252474 RepID=A0A1V2ZYL4_9GAMM|nr:primosomal protein N' [Thioalkalivibrio halophilus]OOC10190.1 primosomal protein N' [Thioalkalivibrio halophilus]
MPDTPASAPSIVRVAIDRPLNRLFDYRSPPDRDVRPGMRVRVPFGPTRLTGVVMEAGVTSEMDPGRLRAVSEVLDATPILPDSLRELLGFGGRYYHHPIGEVVLGALPPALRRGRPLPEAATPEPLWAVTEQGHRALADGAVRGERQRAIVAALADPDSAPGGRLDRPTLAGILGRRPAPRELERLAERGWLECRPPEHPTDVPPEADSAAARPLTPEQQAAVDALTPGEARPLLLEGVTGSGKTEVYLRMAERVVARGEQVLVLIPEIALTPQLAARIQARFPGRVALLHSGLAEGERLRAWASAARGEARVVVGTRSALFTPLPEPGLIVVDEEHDAAFKQQDGFRYNARDLAIKRGQLEAIPVVLGSATPTLETLQAARQGRYTHCPLRTRPDGTAPPRIEAVDTRVHTPDEGLTSPLLDAMQATLAGGQQCFVLLNRRGYARTLACDHCGWVADCRHCDARLTVHAGNPRAVCHLCGHHEPVPDRCPECGAELARRGLGTQRLEQALARHFPQTPLIRLDRDSIRHKGALEEALERIRSLDAAIVVGTQMLAKGHDFPRVGLVGVIDVDQGLYSVDLRAAEHTLQLIVQAAGRAGRGEAGGRVLLQTGHPEHPLIRGLDAADYTAMVRPLLDERAESGFPPFGHLALVRVEAEDANTAETRAGEVATPLRRAAASGVRVLGPAPAPRHRVNRRYREQILVQSGDRRALHATLHQARRAWEGLTLPREVRIALDVDPVSLA